MADLRSISDMSGREAVALLDAAGISATRCPVACDPRRPTDTGGLKLGTLTVTSLGMGTDEMALIADLVVQVIDRRDLRTVREVNIAIRDLRRRFPRGPIPIR
jgi:glycine hydroxymethyltransferase